MTLDTENAVILCTNNPNVKILLKEMNFICTGNRWGNESVEWRKTLALLYGASEPNNGSLASRLAGSPVYIYSD